MMSAQILTFPHELIIHDLDSAVVHQWSNHIFRNSLAIDLNSFHENANRYLKRGENVCLDDNKKPIFLELELAVHEFYRQLRSSNYAG